MRLNELKKLIIDTKEWEGQEVDLTGRDIGSIELVSEDEIETIVSLIEKAGLKTKIIKVPDDGYTIVYFQNIDPKILELYRKYEESNGKATSLEDHALLGKAFGYNEDNIKWFLNDLAADY